MNLEDEIKILYKIKKGIVKQAHNCITNGNYSALIITLKYYKKTNDMIEDWYAKNKSKQ